MRRFSTPSQRCACEHFCKNLSSPAFQIHNHGVNTNQQNYVHPVLHQPAEKTRIRRPGSGLGVSRCQGQPSGGQAEIYGLVQGQVLSPHPSEEHTNQILTWVFSMQELTEAYEREGNVTGKPRLLLSAAVPAGQKYIDGGFEIAEISKYECPPSLQQSAGVCGNL